MAYNFLQSECIWDNVVATKTYLLQDGKNGTLIWTFRSCRLSMDTTLKYIISQDQHSGGSRWVSGVSTKFSSVAV